LQGFQAIHFFTVICPTEKKGFAAIYSHQFYHIFAYHANEKNKNLSFCRTNSLFFVNLCFKNPETIAIIEKNKFKKPHDFCRTNLGFIEVCPTNLKFT